MQFGPCNSLEMDANISLGLMKKKVQNGKKKL